MEEMRRESSEALFLKLASPTSSNTGSLRSFQRDTEELNSEEPQTGAYEQPEHNEWHAPAHTAKAMHHSEDAWVTRDLNLKQDAQHSYRS